MNSRREYLKVSGALLSGLLLNEGINKLNADEITKHNNVCTLKLLSQLSEVSDEYDIVIVYEKDRGGIFYKDDKELENSGTIFNGKNCSWKRLYDGLINVKWFGALGDGKTIDTKAFQNAINTGETIFVPEGHYLIDLTLKADTIFMCGVETVDGSVIEYIKTDGSALFHTVGYYNNCKYTSLKNLKLKGNYKNNSLTECIAIKFENNSLLTDYCDGIPNKLEKPKEDIDAYLEKCHISEFSKSLYISGRGLYVDNCIFSLTNIAMFFHRNNPINEYIEDDQKSETGARAYWIRNSRFHAMSGGTIIKNTELNCEYLKGILFANNYIDTSAQIIDGACRESLFTGNNHIYGNKDLSIFSSDYNWENVIISSNNFSCIKKSKTNSSRENKNIISFGKILKPSISNLIFCNNTIEQVANETIKINASTVNSLNINNNIFNNIAINAVKKHLNLVNIKTVMFANKVLFNSNIINIANEANSNVQKNIKYLVEFDGKVYNSECLNNKFNENSFFISNKNAFTPNSIIQSKIILHKDTRINSNDMDRAIFNETIFKKSKTSNILIHYEGKFIINKIEDSLPILLLLVNGNSDEKIYPNINQISKTEFIFSFSKIIKYEFKKLNLQLSLAKYASNVDFSNNTIITIQEIEQ